MKQLLEEQFSKAFDANGHIHPVKERIINGDISFRDEKACSVCKHFFYSQCGHQTFLIHTTTDIHSIDIELYFNSFHQLKGERCDILFYDQNKCVLMDMYCGMSEYLNPHLMKGEIVAGKKEKVRIQISETIERLYSVPAIATFLDRLPIKEGVFGYRAKDEHLFLNTPKVISSTVQMFLRWSAMQANRRLAAPMEHGFRFLMNSYPHIYQW